MNTLKYIGISLLSLIVLFIAFAFFQDKEVTVSRSIVISAPMNDVFDQFNDMEKRLKWSPWETMDTTMKSTLGDITKGVGASYSWTSEDSDVGTIKYKEVVENQLIESELYFGESNKEPAQGLMIFSEVGDGIKVTWEMHMDLGNNPFMRIMGRFMDDMAGASFEKGLTKVKEICETNVADNPYADVEIKLIQIESKPYIGILDSCSVSEMEAKLEADWKSLESFLSTNELKSDGFNRIIYSVYEPPTKVVFEPLIVLVSQIEASTGRIRSGQTYEGKVITATSLGAYEKSYHVWEALDAYVKNNYLQINGMPWEQYENTPRDEPNPDKLITHIFMPVK